METIIYVNNNHNVETYLVNIDVDRLTEIKEKINAATPKGNIRKKIARTLRVPENKKIEILTEKRVIFRNLTDVCYVQKETHAYFYKFYLYSPHPLYNICEMILKNNVIIEPLNYSFLLKKLLGYKPLNFQDKEFYNEILSCFTFTKYTTDELLESDIDLSKKKSILQKLKTILLKSENQEKHFLPKSYIKIIDEKIRMKEYISSQKRFRTIKYSEEYKNHIKKKNLFSLPTSDSLKAQNII